MTARDVVVTRTIDAPVSRVWDAWTQPAEVMRWWGPAGWTSPEAHMDVRAGASSRVSMRSPDGVELHNLGTYQQVVPEVRLEFTMEFCDPSGRVVDPTDLGLPPGIPVPVRHVVTLTASGGESTELTVTEYGYSSEMTYQMSLAGLEQTLDKMAASLTSG